MGARSGERQAEQDFVDSCANHLTRGLAARPRHRWRSESAPPAPHRPGASRLLVLVRLRLAPQPRSLVGAQCALEKKLAARTPQRLRSMTAEVFSGHRYALTVDSLFNDSWLHLEPLPRFPQRVRASRQKLGMPGQRSSATPIRSAHEYERTLRFQTLCRTLADVAVWPTSISSRGAYACLCWASTLAARAQREALPYRRTRGSYGP